MRIGQGFDSHQWDDDLSKPLILGGIKFDSDSSLKGHSDGDVIIHACIDSLLGAAGLGDIGTLSRITILLIRTLIAPNYLKLLFQNCTMRTGK